MTAKTTESQTGARPCDSMGQVVRWAIVENIVTLLLFATIIIFAPGAWKWAALGCLLNLNSLRQTGD